MEGELLQLSANLIEISARNTASIIQSKIKTSKAKKNDKDTIAELEEIINNLIDDKMELERIAQAYEQELNSQKITEEDIKYISDNIIPVLGKFLTNNQIEDIEQIQSILSVETFTILQLLGFNYKKAIGEPLTMLLKKNIEAKIPIDQTLNSKLMLSLSNLALDKDATERYFEITGGNKSN